MNTYNNHEVARLLAEAIGDDCACNVNCNDEWLPYCCDFANTVCPNVCGVACWEQYLKYLYKREYILAKERQKAMRKVIAVDFDGCIVKNKYPDIGEPNMNVISDLNHEQLMGTALILWTCREGKELEQAVDFCKGLGLTFDAVNENLPERVALFGNDSRKIGADEYWDDKAVKKGD